MLEGSGAHQVVLLGSWVAREETAEDALKLTRRSDDTGIQGELHARSLEVSGEESTEGRASGIE